MDQPEEKKGLSRALNFTKFSTNMRTLRVSKQWSMKEATKMAELKPSMRWEQIEYGRGAPTLSEVVRICECLGQTMDDMLNKECTVTIEFK